MSILVLDSDAHRRRADALALNVKLKILENQKSEIETKIAAAPEAEPLLHPALANVYRKTVAELQTIIHNPETSREAFGLIRGLIDAVILTPVNGELEIELRGDLASILALSKTGGNKAFFTTEKALQDGCCGLLEMSWHLFTWGNEVEIIKPKRLASMLRKQLEICSAHMTT